MLTDDELDKIEAAAEAATPGPWSWNSYSGIAARVPKGHVLDDSEEGEPPIAWICWIDGGPTQRGHGDQLHNAPARANAAFIESADPPTVGALIAEIRRLRPVLAAAEALMGHTERQEYDPRALGALWDAVRTAKEGEQ